MLATTVPVLTDELMKAPQAARWLQISDRFLAKLVAEGRLKAVRIGRSIRFRREELERFARRNQK